MQARGFLGAVPLDAGSAGVGEHQPGGTQSLGRPVLAGPRLGQMERKIVGGRKCPFEGRHGPARL